jgi:hypothetical protein
MMHGQQTLTLKGPLEQLVTSHLVKTFSPSMYSYLTETLYEP